MGGICSKSSSRGKGHQKVSDKRNGHDETYKAASGRRSDVESKLAPPRQSMESMKKQLEESKQVKEILSYPDVGTAQLYGTNAEDFYDGIPRFQILKSQSVRSKPAAVAKVSEVSSRLGRAGTVGLGKAVEVLDTLGSSMTNFNANGGFVSSVVTKGNELEILSFEVANTIVKGSSLMQSLSRRSIRNLKEVVLPSEGVQNLVSKDMDELLRIVEDDKREELKIFSDEVIRFGNRCKDPQWHNIDRYFEKVSRDLTPKRQLKDQAESVIELLMNLVQHTAELYHEFQVLDRIEHNYYCKRLENSSGDNLVIIRAELKKQKKQVKSLKKKSLWSRSLEEVMEKLVDIVHYILLEIHNTFGSADSSTPVKESVSHRQRLGPAGLALHYANIVMQIDTLVARSSNMPSNTRDALYQSLPPNIISALRSKIQSFHVKEELTVEEIKDEMEKTLRWLVPVSTNTAKAHHGFGWVGEWANTGTEVNRKPSAGPMELVRIETLYHADKEKTDAHIFELVLWLHHLASRSKANAKTGAVKSPLRSPVQTAVSKSNQQRKEKSTYAPSVSSEEEQLLQDASKRKWTSRPQISKSVDFDTEKKRLRKRDRLSKSCSYSQERETRESATIQRLPSGVPIFGMGKEKALDAIDRVNVPR
ncbi:hypothetical protein HS088_TW07G00633 [Tripterygium wilfordii]|uniref:Uncharacterized protein n=1 Tax=Tripterygium wilfordii TaxID=458696 RepID=A0A7J7DFF3_TRIWF|nr:protein PSK SIMULATOR 1-like [Tripterygium wilfordii]XP_038707504.1 protein PSK SIMULATOR 1-like [Tripterygium wilfordii]XP_038707505.1 protein PSK SIMULATOR 1-like [Tripterygium wilfordii]XP_038707507.1 protein PSK SIMULATOR 1-like [Tripterygium wilfordii]KAF5745052.1 hypothetical protein HS088_TW07G00633 [Tripterygium wilfordii]